MRIKNLEEYQKEKENFENSPERFWEEKADTFKWHQKWNNVLEWDFHKANINWFKGG